MTTQATITPVAPSHPQGQGTSTPGGHYLAYKACPPFDLAATLKLISGTNPWRPNTPGGTFYEKVLRQNPATVGAAIEIGGKANFKPREVQNHLRWLFTWGGSHVEIGGKLFSPPVAPVAPKAAKAPKAATKKNTLAGVAALVSQNAAKS